MDNSRLARPFLIIPSVFMIAALGIPLIYMVVLSFRSSWSATGGTGWSLAQYRRFFADTYYLRNVLWVSIKLGAVSTASALILGYPVALIIARTPNQKLKNALLLMSIVPLWVNIVVRGFGFSVLISDTGFVNRMLLALGAPQHIKFMSTELGVLIGFIQVSIPYIVLPLVGVLESIPTSLEEAAYSVGAKPFKTFRSIIFPLSLPGVLAGSLITFALNASGFAIPAMLGGGKVRMMALCAYEEAMALGNFPFAALLGLLLIVASAFCVIPYLYFSSRLYYGKGR